MSFAEKPDQRQVYFTKADNGRETERRTLKKYEQIHIKTAEFVANEDSDSLETNFGELAQIDREGTSSSFK